MSILACAACLSTENTAIQTVDVTEQHRLYSPHNAAMVERLNEAASATSLHYTIHKCRNCGLEFCDPMTAPTATWYGLAYQALDLYPHDRWEFLLFARKLSSDDRLLELGCGSGEFLKLCRDRGTQAFGLDFSPDAVDSCKQSGLDAATVAIGDDLRTVAPFAPSKVAAFHVLEHLARPVDLFESVRSVAAPACEFWISIPSVKRPTRFFGEAEFLDAPPHHMTRWTEPALREIGLRSGWLLREVRYEPTTIRQGAWHFATRMPRYKRLQERGGSTSRVRERLLRWSLYPYAAACYLRQRRDLSGFSVAARYVLK